MFGRSRSGARRSRRARSNRPAASQRTYRRKPLFELLEDRRMLAAFTVTSNLDTVNAADGVLTLREAITAANADATTFDTINFAASLAGQTIQLTNVAHPGELTITSAMTIDASSLINLVTVKAFDLTAGAGDGARSFNINDNTATAVNVELKGLTITGGDLADTGNPAANGAAVYSTEYLSISSCTITGNTSGRRGGGVYAKGPTYLYLDTFSNNTAKYGGAVCANFTDATTTLGIRKSTFSKNTGTKSGGAVYQKNGKMNMYSCTISGGSTGGGGAGIALDTVAWTIDKTTISGNKADTSPGAFGGGISLANSNGEITNSTIGTSGALTGNTSNGNGAGMFISGGTAKITKTTITGNTASGTASGGGVFASGATVTISGSTISNNSAGFGAGLYFNNVSAPISTTTISGNIAGTIGGGVFAKTGAIISFDSSTISGNSAVINGGGMYTTGSNTGFVNSTVSGNTAKAFGGGIWAQVPANRSLNILYSTITKNTSDFDASGVGSGGGIYLKTGNGTVDLKNSIIAGNNDLTNTAPDIDNTSAGGNPTLTAKFSLIGNNKNSGLAAGNPGANGNRIGSAAAPINALLGPLQNNGGPTKTHSLQPGSFAINNGDPAVTTNPKFDQRGTPFSRVADGRLDIGAFEVVSPPTKPTMNLLASSDTGMFNNDRVTNKMQPAFGGFGPISTDAFIPATVLVYAQATDSNGDPSGDPFVIGTGTVGPDASDGFIGNDLGVWEVTVEPLADGKYNFFARFDTPVVPIEGAVTHHLSDPVANLPDNSSTAISVPIPANGVATSPINISSSSADPFVADVNVSVDITFPRDGNLTLTLISPSGTSILLSNHRGGNDPNFSQTTFDDAAATRIQDGSPPFHGSFRPDEPLSTLIGEPANGTWTLFVTNSAGQTGTIDDWGLSIVTPIMVVIDTVAPNTPSLDLLPFSDTGRNDSDNITRNNNPEVSMTSTDPNGQFAKLLFTDNLKFRIYDRFVDTGGSAVPEFLIYDSAQDGFADMNMTTGDMFTALTQITAFLPQFGTPTSPAVKPDETLADGTHNLKLVVEDRAGNISHDFQLTVTVDTTPPPVSFGLPTAASATDGLIAASDSGVTTVPATYADRITNVTTPTFWGRAEANSIVQLYYDKNADGKIQVSGPGADIFLGQTTAIPLDGNDAYPNGYWEIRSALDLNQIVGVPKDGLRRLLVTAEDVAGNPRPSFATDFPVLQPTDQLQIFIDTQGPQVTAVTPNNSNFNLFALKPAQVGPTPLVNSLKIAFKDLPSRVLDFWEYDALVPGIATTPGNYVLVGDHVGTIAIKTIQIDQPPTTAFTITGNITAVTSTTVTVASFAGATVQPEVGDYLQVSIAGDNVRRVAAYDATTGTMTLDAPFVTLPAVGSLAFVTKVATATITLNFFAPLPDDRYTLTVKDNLVDAAGNKLDGESHQNEPQPPLFPSGDGVPGGNFVARFTVDSRPELGNYVSQNINIDINGNFVWDPANSQIGNDSTNVDLSFTLQAQSAAGATVPGGFNVHDLLFAGKFTKATADAPVVPRFDQLAAFGNAADLGGAFRWLIDTNSDGVITAVTDISTIQPTLANFNVAGAIPVAGNFDNIAANGDEIGLYNAGKWALDTNHNFVIDAGDTFLTTTLLGAPIVGDFDGDGKDDLAVFNNNQFFFNLANDGLADTPDATFTWGFPGVLDKPVAADMDGDGIDDIGLWVPRTDATNPFGVAQWYFLVSNDFTAPGVPAVHTPGSIAKINHAFSPTPFGHDIFAEFGDERSLPIVGNFDPPLAASAPVNHLNTAMGDYDGNGRVEQADYSLWKSSFGSTNSLAADGNGNGIVDSADYSVWRDHLGAVVPGAGGGAESLVADGIDLSGWSSPSQVAVSASSVGADIVASSLMASSDVSAKAVPVFSAATSASNAEQVDQALLLLFSETPSAVVAKLGGTSITEEAEEPTAQADALGSEADALSIAWQTWGDS